MNSNNSCGKCKNGVIETGNNDLPCDCPLGDKALFNECGIVGTVTGKEIKQHFLNNSPEPLTLPHGTPASQLPGRHK